MKRKELIKKYLDFFESKNHRIIPASSLVPENDPTVLFTTAGMHPLVPYLLGQEHPLGKRIVNIQGCIRTQDIEEVGDSTHHTFFEMLGNWSLGDYFKKESIEFSFEFLTEVLNIPLNKIAITCFAGDEDAPKDEESTSIWMSLGIPKERIAFLGKEDNWWGPAGDTGPCGTDTEIFYWKSKDEAPKKHEPSDERWVEIWNNVFMEYDKNEKGKYKTAKQKNVDTGMGLERTILTLSGLEDSYLTSSFKPIIEKIEEMSGKDYDGSNVKAMRIIADHIKAAVMIIADGTSPSNTERGYVLRRLIRRAVKYGRELNLKNFTKKIGESVFEIYDDYDNLQKNKQKILSELELEEEKFLQTLEKGMEIFNKILDSKKQISGKDAFLLYQSYGFPVEMTKELAEEKKIKIDGAEFEKELKKHRELSRTASQGRFKSGLADSSEKTKKLHTTTHLLNEVLRKVLKDENIKQRGSNITPERLRFDFNFPRKLTDAEIEEIEENVNKKINESLSVKKEEISLDNALKSGAQSEFGAKYPDFVSVYKIGNFSKEICTGPHVENTKELGKFKITKEESSSSGVRRIKAVLE